MWSRPLADRIRCLGAKKGKPACCRANCPYTGKSPHFCYPVIPSLCSSGGRMAGGKGSLSNAQILLFQRHFKGMKCPPEAQTYSRGRQLTSRRSYEGHVTWWSQLRTLTSDSHLMPVAGEAQILWPHHAPWALLHPAQALLLQPRRQPPGPFVRISQLSSGLSPPCSLFSGTQGKTLRDSLCHQHHSQTPCWILGVETASSKNIHQSSSPQYL